jgi:glycine dehydrogenase subunit 1
MPYIPNSEEDQKKMLEKTGAAGIDQLFSPIPEKLRLKKPPELPSPLSEPELVKHLEELSRRNNITRLSFLGGGVYNHFIPSVIGTLVMRPEFATAYTPYQAEVAQGTLQIIYEFQTHLCRLTGMDVSNASMYDGATAMAEAAIMAANHTGRNKIVVSETVNPLYRDVLQATVSGREMEIVTVPANGSITDYGAFNGGIDDEAACLIMAQPNFFGYLEEPAKGEKAIHDVGGLFVTVIDPISLGILKTPAEYDADIAVGEGQSLGIPRSFGGPLLGLFICRKEFVRRLPGRLVARTVDVDGRTGFVLTMQTREQHIRRDKATSNICTSEALCAAAATIYLSLMGKKGLPRVARLSTERAHYLAEKITRLDGFSVWSDAPFFKEFVIETPVPSTQMIAKMSEVGIAAGIDLGRFYPALDHHLLVAVTEMISFEDCDRLADYLARVAAGEKSAGTAVVE